MAQIVITANGDYNLPLDGDSQVTHTDSTTIMILENSSTATLIFGVADSTGSFVAYPNGAISSGAVLSHGKGAKLMVRTSGISANSVTINLY